MCPPVSPHKGASIVQFPAHHACVFGMETLARGRSGGHAGTAPTVSFGWIACGWLVSFGRIACKWFFCLCRIVWKNMMEMGRGGACVPTRVALRGRIHHSSPRTMRVFLVWKRRYANVRAGTQAPPLRFRVGVFICLLVGENGTHEPTPSVLYFCQPRVADDRRLPWVKSWRGTYAIGIVLFKINLHAGDHSFAACGNDVR